MVNAANKYQPGTRVSEYVLETCIGTGTFGEVWRARHHVWQDELVAIKLPTEASYLRFLQREGVVVHGLRHPNIVRVRGLDPYADIPYLVMELIDGPSLREVIDEHPHGMPIPVVLKTFRGILQGVAAAHAGNVVHRDLKPGNVLLDLRGRPLEQLTEPDVRIGDFGLGVSDADTLRSMVMQSASIEREREGSAIAGTLAYMAPEVRDSGQTAGPAADLYSLGVVLFEMLTGKRPAGVEVPGTLRAEVPQALDDLFCGLYASLERRLPTAEAVLRKLDEQAVPPPLPAGVVETFPAESTTDITPCPACGVAPHPDDQFCTQCGSQLVTEVLRCPACGGYPGRHDRYCIFCGQALPWARE